MSQLFLHRSFLFHKTVLLLFKIQDSKDFIVIVFLHLHTHNRMKLCFSIPCVRYFHLLFLSNLNQSNLSERHSRSSSLLQPATALRTSAVTRFGSSGQRSRMLSLRESGTLSLRP